MLLQQRAAVKTRFARRWANACCGHPAPGVRGDRRRRPPAWRRSSARHRCALREIGVYVYRADDEATGRVEHEYDHVLLGARTG